MELKISKIQWKKVLAFALTLCMTISMVQLPVNAEETTETVSAPKHFKVMGLEDYEQTATFFDAAADGSRDALNVTSIEEVDKTYEVDPTTGYYDAKWFSFTPSEDGRYIFKGENIDSDVDSYGALMEKDGETYRYIAKNDDGDSSQFAIKSTLQKGKTYYLCAGYWRKGSEKYNVKVSKMEDGKELKENESDTFSTENTPKYYTFVPTESGYYNLKFSWDSDKSLDQRSYVVENQNGEEVYDIDSSWNQSGYTAKYSFEQGKTYYFTMNSFTLTDTDNYEEVQGNITISILKIPVEEIKEDKPGSFKTGSDSARFKFTVNDTGWYNLRYSWDGEQDSVSIDNEFRLTNESDVRLSCISVISNRLYFVYLEKGKTYFLDQDRYTFDYYDGADVPESVNISISKAESDNISTSKNGTVASGKSGKLFIFTPDKSGYYNVEAAWDKEKLPDASIDGRYNLYEDYSNPEDSGINEVDNGDLDRAFKFQARKGHTYYLAVCEPALKAWDDEGDYYTKDGDISISISDLESKVDTITSKKPGEYVANLYNGNDSKIFKYTPVEDGYYKLSFDWDKKLTEKMYIDPYIRVTNENTSYVTSVYNLDETEKVFMKKGETYYIRVSYINIGMNDGEDWPEENVQVTFKINMSQLPMNEISYGKSGNIKVNSESKIFKFTAQQDGKHVLICKWNGADIRMGTWNGTLIYGDEYTAPTNMIKKEEDTCYRKVSFEKGQTYYIDLTELSFKSATTGKRITDAVDVSVTIAYYNGKTDLDTIKNTKPWMPEDNKDNTDKPNNGNNNKPNNSTEKPNTNKTNKPATIKVSKIKISAISNKIAAGKKVKLTAAVAPANASNKAVKWTTSNKKVAVVSKNGVVTVNKKAGGKSVVITAIAADGGTRATYKIKVMKDAVKKVTITGKKVAKAGKKLKLKAKVAAGKKANKKLVWSSSNTKFATVNQKGVVKTTKAGKGKKVKITATATDGSNKKKVFTIKIK